MHLHEVVSERHSGCGVMHVFEWLREPVSVDWLDEQSKKSNRQTDKESFKGTAVGEDRK
jgi:hypothetical protein